MALAIKSIPVLSGEVAMDFVRKAELSLKKKNKKDFSVEMSASLKILKNSNLK